jgi:hypothetical protein
LTTAQLAAFAAIVWIRLGLRKVIAFSKTITACACVTGGYVLRELTTTGTVAATSTDNSLTGALTVRIVEGVDEGTKSLLTNEVAVFAITVAATVAADMVHTEGALALVVTTAGHAVGFERLTLTQCVAPSSDIAVRITEAILGTFGLELVGFTVAVNRSQESTVLGHGCIGTRRVVRDGRGITR